MIRTTRLNDSEMVVNADLIEVIEATPDTVITLIDGTRFVVREAPEVLVERIQQYRAALYAAVDALAAGPGGSVGPVGGV